MGCSVFIKGVTLADGTSSLMDGRKENNCQQLVSRPAVFCDEIKQKIVEFRPEAAANVESSHVGEVTGKF